MRRTILLALPVLSMTFGLIGCGGTSTATPTPEVQAEVQADDEAMLKATEAAAKGQALGDRNVR